MKREMLKEIGLTDEQIDKVMAENGADIEKQKAAAETSKAELDGLKSQLAERDKQLKELQSGAGDNAALKEQLAALEAANKEQKAAFEQQMQDLRFQTALESSTRPKLSLTMMAPWPDCRSSWMGSRRATASCLSNSRLQS